MSQSVNIPIGADHAGFDLKEEVINHLEQNGYRVRDYGTNSRDSVDYPDYVHPIAEAISNGTYNFGILICGSANGVAMSANKHSNIRAAICWQEEITRLARQHNDANIICLPSRFITVEEALSMVDVFLSTPFEGGRHQRRVDKIAYAGE